jgi:tRNA dimethylallyltransferase
VNFGIKALMAKQKIILVAGPTASGKSARAMELARQIGGTIINADAMQVYAGLPILSAQPGRSDLDSIPHKLYGTMDPAEASSVGRWLELAGKAIDETVAEGRIPILTGGTGLYFQAWLGGLADIPDIPASVREDAEKLYAEIGEEDFRKKLANLDVGSAGKLAKNDRQRLIRAYEVAIHTGRPISEWQKETKSNVHETFMIKAYCLLPEREALYADCDARFENMIRLGAIEEAKEFLKRGLDPELPAMKTLGLREITSYLGGEIKLEDAISKARQMTRNYAKRQMTWFRNQWPFESN